LLFGLKGTEFHNDPRRDCPDGDGERAEAEGLAHVCDMVCVCVCVDDEERRHTRL
jgi:hypothetical protein